MAAKTRGSKMAHMAKYGAGSVGALTAHFERRQINGAYLRFKNQDIDLSRTPLNYNLAPDRKTTGQRFVKERISEVRHMNRADMIHMAVWVVTAPKSLPEPEQKRFFESAYAFMSERYREENVVSAYVHMDEATPHMHFAFVPTVDDKRHPGEQKLCAKEAITRQDLKTFHEDLELRMEKEMGRKVGILNEATREGNLAIEELKRGTALKELERLKSELALAKAECQKLKSEAEKLYSELREREKIAAIEPKRTITGAIKGVTAEQIESLKERAAEAGRLSRELEKAKESLKGLERVKSNFDRSHKMLLEKTREAFSLKNRLDEIDKALDQNKELKNELEKGIEKLRERDRDLDRER